MTSLNKPRAAVVSALACLLVACGGGGNDGTSNGASDSNGGTSGPVATSFYVPVSSENGGTWTGLWLISAAQPGAAPIQVTRGKVDIATSGATFSDWTYSASSRLRGDLQPRFFVYGSGGHLFGISLTQPGRPAQLSSGSYLKLCSLTAAQAGPFSSSASFVIAQVSSTSTSNCDSTWIVSTHAGSGAAPAATSGLLQFLGGLKDTSSGRVTDFLIDTGTELDLYSPSTMTARSTVLTGLTGTTAAPLAAFGSMDAAQGVVVEQSSSSPNPVSDSVYLIRASGATLLGTYSSPFSPSCGRAQIPRIDGAVVGTALLYAVQDPAGGTGYTVYSVPLSGGTPTAVYTDTTDCEELTVGSTAGRLVVDQLVAGTSTEQNVSLDPAGPSGQTPVSLSSVDDSQNSDNAVYLVDGNTWLEDFAFDPVSGNLTDITSSVVDVSNGHTLKTYAHSVLGGDFWKGINSDGSVERGPMLVGTGTLGAGCSELAVNSIEAVDPDSFASNVVSISSAACMGPSAMFGPAPLALGLLGSNIYAMSNPSGSKIQLIKIKLTAPTGGTFFRLFDVAPY